jgi:transcription elongation factor GreA
MERNIPGKAESQHKSEKKKRQILITQETYDRLHVEREQLKKRYREETSVLAETLTGDDNDEHAARHDALKNQGSTLARLLTVDEILNHGILISPRQQVDRVKRGNTAKLRHENDSEDSEFTITLVGGKEDAMTREDWFHLDSPFGAAVQGKKIGDKFTTVVRNRDNTQTVNRYTVLDILPGQFAKPRESTK